MSVPGSAGAFSRDFTLSLVPECRVFSGALKSEKLKAPLIPGPEGAVDTNNWCIIKKQLTQNIASEKANFNRHSSFKDNRDGLADVVRSERPFRMRWHNIAEAACYYE